MPIRAQAQKRNEQKDAQVQNEHLTELPITR